MIRLLIFYAVLLFASGYAMRKGGAPERWMAGLFMAATLSTNLVALIQFSDYRTLDLTRLSVDVALLGGMMILMAKADRFWPIYATAFHLLAVLTHGVRAFDPIVLPPVYYRVTAWLAYPTLILLVLGTYRHQLRKLSGLIEHDWTSKRQYDGQQQTARGGQTSA